MTNTRNVTDHCFSSLSLTWPTCSCTSTDTKTGKSKTVVATGLGSRLIKTRRLCRRRRVETRSWSITCSLHCAFLILAHGSPQATCINRNGGWRSFLSSISPTPGGQVFIHLVFDVPSPKNPPKCFAQPRDHHAFHTSNTGSALKKKELFKN